MEELNIAEIIGKYGFPIVAAVGLGYFVYYVWNWATKTVDPVIGETQKTLIGLIDQVRMLDNDLIRLNQKLNTILQFREVKDSDEKNTTDSPDSSE